MLSIFLSKAFGYIGIWYAAPIGWVLGIIPSAIRYHSGTWKKYADKLKVKGENRQVETDKGTETSTCLKKLKNQLLSPICAVYRLNLPLTRNMPFVYAPAISAKWVGVISLLKYGPCEAHYML